MNREESIVRQRAIALMSRRATEPNFDWLGLLKLCGGYYECPKDAQGKRLGPIVGYAGKDELDRQYVGDVYADFAMAEQYGIVLNCVARGLIRTCNSLPFSWRVDGYCGAPEGGKALATALSVTSAIQYIYPEKKITALATPTSREKSEMAFSRHKPVEGGNYALVEDVLNNFSTTEEVVRLLEDSGARCSMILGFLNRSTDSRSHFDYDSPRFGRQSIPVVSLVTKSIAQYRQDDPYVIEDVDSGNLIRKPKPVWHELEAAMAAVAG